jgi:hypothetical protein
VRHAGHNKAIDDEKAVVQEPLPNLST